MVMCQGKKSDLELKEESREVKKSLSQRDYYLYYNNFIPWMRSLKCARFRTYPFPAVSCRNCSPEEDKLVADLGVLCCIVSYSKQRTTRIILTSSNSKTWVL
jgi:hypothetical protein